MAHIYFQCGKPRSASLRQGEGPSSQLSVEGTDPLPDLLAIPSHHLVIRPEIPFSLRKALLPILQIWETPPLADFLY